MLHDPAPLRQARRSDIPRLSALEIDAYASYRSVGMGDLSDAVAMPVAEFERGIADGTLVVAVDDADVPVGSVLFSWFEGACYVDQLCVARSARGRGLGARLLDAVAFTAGARGVTRLFLTTYADVPWNRAHYARLGWSDVGPNDRPTWLRRIVEAQQDAGFARWPRAVMTADVTVPTLDGDRIRLRPWRLDDAPLVQSVAGDSLIPLITSVPTSGTRVDAEAFVRRQWQRLPEGAGYSFAIALRDARPDPRSGPGTPDETVGQIGVWTKNIAAGRVTIGYWIEPAHRRRGLLTEALSMATTWALDQPGVHRVDLFVEPWNEGSWRAAERCGYVREGLLRNWEIIDGEPRDLFSYSLVRADRIHSHSSGRQRRSHDRAR